MPLSTKIVLLIFLVGVVTVCFAAAALAAHAAFRRSQAARRPLPRSFLWLRRVIFALALIGLACGVYGYFIEPRWLEVAHVRIASARLPAGSRPVRLVHLSDLHCERKVRLEEKLPEVIAGLKPDLIVFTGDALNARSGLRNFQRCMERIAKLAPTFAVRGNWDVDYFPGADLFGGTGVVELDGQAVRVAVDGAEVWVAGRAFRSQSNLDRTFDQFRPDAVSVYLYHTSGEVFEAAKRKVDLYCCGHTHGGQVALPFYGALVTLSKHGKRFEAGLYRVEQTCLYVSRGVGLEGGRAPRVRFCARPEVTLIEIAPAVDVAPRLTPARPSVTSMSASAKTGAPP